MLKAREMIIDFINYSFLLILISFCLFYFLAADRFLIFGQILKSMLPFSLFGVFFLVLLKIKRNLIKSLDNEGVLNEIVAYITPLDLIKDRFVIFFMSLSLMFAGYLSNGFDFMDLFLSLTAFLYMFICHKILFRASEDVTRAVVIRNNDIIKDQLAICFLPLLISAFGLLGRSVDIITVILQGTLALAIMQIWHNLLFKPKN